MSFAITNSNLTPFIRSSIEIGGLIAAEVAGAAVSLASVGYSKDIAPKLMDTTTNAIAKHVIEPHLEFFENGVSFFCHTKDCQPDKTQSREDRAKKIAGGIVTYAPATILGVATTIAARRLVNEKMGMPAEHKWYRLDKIDRHDKNLFFVDNGVHIGASLYLSTIGSGHADNIIDGVTNILHKTFGADEQRARQMATMGTLVDVIPNAAGILVASGYIVHKNYKGI